MENKLYYQDAYIKTFKAKVIKQAQDSAGNWYVCLEQTAFYPTGGGQPNDIGTLADQHVINVEEIDGEIRHYLEGPILDTNKEIAGTIDWERRFDHMQQHTGQHLLSAAFDQLFEYRTIGFHLGAEIVTIDLETDVLTEHQVQRAEGLANQIILENRPIEVKWVTEEELSQYPLRKETKVKDDIRLVIIPDFDYNGCGGTHPKATGEVSSVKVLDWERQKKKVRVQFVCGKRVLKQFQQKQQVLLELTKILNAPEKEMEQAVLRLLENNKSLEKNLEQAQEDLLQYEAKRLLGRSNVNERKLVCEVFQNRTIQELQKLARIITTEDDTAKVYFVSQNENRLQVVCARGTAGTESMKKAVSAALPLINGKGGGNDAFAQGGGDALMSGEQMLQYLVETAH
ncbi:alanyl-tRNA editing protein [Neobacillus drentensis]|uniref:alanyl-tRNA editing protein n=1 Tax=Neobacillus drentensis TaxID=220684 RepID=UPI0028554704|nr:DHHA1 domain-containing protein [Neobacillus drentensis]MDR7237926.1 alanyl-tRNA synthetase [Neobacillus drentensis]